MKKIVLIFLLVIVLLLGIGMNVYAVSMKFYTEQWQGATYDFHEDDPSTDSSYDLSSNFFGFELVARRFYFGVEYGIAGETQFAWGDQDLQITDIRLGCRVVRNDVCTFDIFNSFIFMNGVITDYDVDDVVVDLTLGGNLNLKFGDRLILQGTGEIPLGGEVFAYNIKAGLLLTPNFAITAGYRGYKIVIEEDDYYDESVTSKLYGTTLGVELRF